MTHFYTVAYLYWNYNYTVYRSLDLLCGIKVWVRCAKVLIIKILLSSHENRMSYQKLLKCRIFLISIFVILEVHKYKNKENISGGIQD